MTRFLVTALVCSLLVLSLLTTATTQELPLVKVSKTSLHSGRINPLIYGSFIELWDDHVPGLWAEMLNDRGFEGVKPRADWCHYIGEPNVCDREWDKTGDWSVDLTDPFNGPCCAKLTSTGSPATITQSGLFTKKGMTYHFSGYFRTDSPELRIKVVLKALLPDESWMILASADIPKQRSEWRMFSCDLISTGTTDNAVFEISISGNGSLWMDKLSLMPDDNVNGWRSDVVEAIRELAPPVIRWGGCVIDPGHYKWKDCVGNRDYRVPFENWFWGRIDSNDVGIDEFLQFCEAVQAEPLVCISFADGAQNAADLVHYCNGLSRSTEWGKKRVENGHPEPYNVKYWQIGNELDDSHYIDGFIAIAKAIKSADHDAVIFASFPSEELLRKAWDDLDFVCPHYYRDDFENIEAEIKHIAQMVKKTVPNRDIMLGVTEWNVTNPWGFMRGKLLTMDYAMGNARFLNIFHRNSDAVQLSCRSNLCNSLCDGIIQTKPSGILKTPAYYVMQLYTRHSKPVPVSFSGLPQEQEMSACASEDRNSLCLFILNNSRDPVEIQLDLSEYGRDFAPVSGEVVCDTLNRQQIDIMNHWNAPDQVRTISLPVSKDKIKLPPFSVSAIECARPLPTE